MPGNSFGKLFCVSSFGESHGPAIGCVIDGCPPLIPLSVEDIQPDLDRRRPGQSRYTTQRQEADQVEILSGVFEGKTTGTPIALLIRNTDQRPKDYANIAAQFRPGHADFTYQHKYGIRDYRGGGRSSARETAARVAAGAVAKKVLREFTKIRIQGYLSSLGPIELGDADRQAIDSNAFFCAEPSKLPELEAFMQALIKEGNSIGAAISLEASGVPIGLGEPVFDRLDADIAKAMMSINAVKSVEIGDGLAVAKQKGTEHRDQITPEGFSSNHAGGILGGISTGQDIRVRIAIKPTSSLRIPILSLNQSGEMQEVITKGRHDPCVGIRAVPIAEAMLALVLCDHFLRQQAQNRISVDTE